MGLLVRQFLSPAGLGQASDDQRTFALGQLARFLVKDLVLNDFSFLRDAFALDRLVLFLVKDVVLDDFPFLRDAGGHFARIFETAQGIDD